MNSPLVKRCHFENTVLFVLLCLFAFLICMQSPVDIFSPKGIEYTDSSVFKYVARVMDAGGLPYRDVFDHKGPVLYFINYIGYKINSNFGIWLIGCLFMLVSVFSAYKLSRLFTSKFKSLLAVVIVFSLMLFYYEGGNLTEEYALPPQIISLYIFLDYFLNGKINNLRLIVCGSLFGIVCFLRVNIIPVWLVFCVFVLIDCIAKKEGKKLFNFIAFFLVGCLIVLIPVLIYLLAKGIFKEFIQQYLLFNFLYSSDVERANPALKANSALYFFNNQLIIIATAIVMLKLFKSENKKQKTFYIVYLIYMAVAILLVCMSGQKYLHYGMTLIPMLIYPFALLLNSINKKELMSFSPKAIACLYIVIALIIPNIITLTSNCNNDISNYLIAKEKAQQNIESEKNSYEEMIEYIKEATDEDELISVYGNSLDVLNSSQRFSASKYVYQTTIFVNDGLMAEYYSDLEAKDVRFVVVQGSPSPELNGFFENNNFKKSKQFGGYEIYIAD